MSAIRAIKSEAGFSLLELMTVVAVVGLLTVIAIPNFKHFLGKARASESRMQLSALFSAEKTFYAEFGAYHTDAANVGYRPNGQLKYLVGFNAESVHTILEYMGPALDPTKLNTDVICASVGCQNFAVTPAGLALSAVSLASTATATTFTAAAEGFIGGSTTDVWSINENKALVNDAHGGY